MFLKPVLAEKMLSLLPNNTLKCKLYSFWRSTSRDQNIPWPCVWIHRKQATGSVYIANVRLVGRHNQDDEHLRIKSNIVQGSYKDGKRNTRLHSFYPTLKTSFKIVETPSNVLYLPVKVRRLDNVVDQKWRRRFSRRNHHCTTIPQTYMTIMRLLFTDCCRLPTHVTWWRRRINRGMTR